MYKILKKNLDLGQLEILAKKIANNLDIGDLLFLKGELGAGKTTFCRLLIHSLYKRYSIDKPNIIRSPSFPILITYELNNFQIYHYDFYRLKNDNELKELNFFEEINKNITIVEWPEIIFKYNKIANYYLFNFKIINSKKKEIEIFHTKKNNLQNVV